MHQNVIGKRPGHPVRGVKVDDVSVELGDPVRVLFVYKAVERHADLDEIGDPALDPVGTSDGGLHGERRKTSSAKAYNNGEASGCPDKSVVAIHTFPLQAAGGMPVAGPLLQ
jgi:hypothetical protein